MADFVDHLTTGVIRNNPLGPVTLNQFQANIHTIDALVLMEHFDDGQHNALEIPWILGHVNSVTTGYMFNTAYGGGTITRPSTGHVRVSAVSGVIPLLNTPTGSDVPAAAALGNVSDSSVATYPHVIEVELVSDTTIEMRTRRMTSTLGAPGNVWADVDVSTDLAIHAQKQPVDVSLLGPGLLKVRRDFLTEQATDWNSLARNQATVYKALSLEHTSAGAHLVNRIAKAWGWFKPAAGPIFSIVDSERVSSVTRVSTGVVQVNLSDTLSSVNVASCFPQAQPATADELIIINGYCTSTTQFTFYIYAYSVAEDQWTRADRSFSAAMFGTPA
jgi:hypothetical protein